MALRRRRPSRRDASQDNSGLRHFMSVAAWPALALAALALVALTLVAHLSAPARHTLVVAALPYWNIQTDTAVVLANRQDVNEVSPWIYGISPSGAVVVQTTQGQAATATADMDKLRAAGMRVVPTIANITSGKWSDQPIEGILHNPALMRQHVGNIVALADREDYAGVDIDYEGLLSSDKQVFSQFIGELSTAMHAHGKIVTVDVFPQTSAGEAAGNPLDAAQDLAALGKSADQIRVMAYNNHWANSPPGAVAPIGWVRSVVRYTVSQVPAGKVVLGVPLYGFDWGDGPAQTISWLQALRLSRQYHVQPQYSKASQAPTFSYDSGGRDHVVWFENAASSEAKFYAVKGAGIAGTFLWMYGYEDPGTWPALRTALPLSGPGASSTSTAVP
jgi:spore germination protein